MNDLAEISKALSANPKAKFRIEGYRTSSGDKTSGEYTFIHNKGYLNLINKSLEWLTRPNKEIEKDLIDAGCSEDELIFLPKAVGEMVDSTASNMANFRVKIETDQLSDVFCSTTRSSGDKSVTKVELFNLQGKLDGSENAIANLREKNYRNEITMLKSYIRAVYPLSEYVGKLVLEDGKFSDLKIIE